MLFEAGLCLFGVAERHATLWIAVTIRGFSFGQILSFEIFYNF